MQAPDPLPLAARRAAWDRLWRILLTPPRTEPADPDETRISPPELPADLDRSDAGCGRGMTDSPVGRQCSLPIHRRTRARS